MGTETSHSNPRQSTRPLHRVKLNNPLMGTETHLTQILGYLLIFFVKLNNPLMGTETRRKS